MKSILNKIGDSSEENESGITINLSISGTTVNETNPPIPTGFYHVGNTTIADGYVISDVQGDDLANSQGGNQFVWVPVQKDQVISLSVTSGEDIETIELYNPYGDKIIDLTNQGKSYNEAINTYGNMDCINGKYTAIVTTANNIAGKALIVRSLYAIDTFQDDTSVKLPREKSDDEIAQEEGFEDYNDMVAYYSSAEGISNFFYEDMDTEAEVFAALGEYIGQEITTRSQFGQIYSQLTVEMIRNQGENEVIIENNAEFKDYTDLTEAGGTRVLYSESVNNNGGFYIGRYEAGAEAARTSGNSSDTVSAIITANGMPVCKANQTPYNNITRNQANGLVESMYDSQEFTCAVLTGAAWDRTLGFLTEAGTNNKTLSQIIDDSTAWGVYYNAEFPITNTSAKYSLDYGDTYTQVSGSGYTKEENTMVLLTTGATERNISKNIYDIAGNLSEWTNESWRSYVVVRGGDNYNRGDYHPADLRDPSLNNASNPGVGTGFRPALFIQ